MNHIMIDLETLGVQYDSAFISIGACSFDIDTGDIKSKFNVDIDWEDALKTRSVTASTIQWWMRQSTAAQDAVCGTGIDLRASLIALSRWFRGINSDTCVWSNGATFDIAMLEHAFITEELDIPWFHWNVRDVRTICALAFPEIPKGQFDFKGTPHVAVDDAIHQAQYVSAMWQALRKGMTYGH